MSGVRSGLGALRRGPSARCRLVLVADVGIAVLLAFDQPGSEVIIGVVSYRLVNFWLPLGATSYLSVQATLSEKRHPVRSTLRDLVDEAVEEAHRFAAWARERAIRLPSRSDS